MNLTHNTQFKCSGSSEHINVSHPLPTDL